MSRLALILALAALFYAGWVALFQSVDQLAACDDGVLMLWPALHSGPPGCVPILEVAATQSQCDAHDI